VGGGQLDLKKRVVRGIGAEKLEQRSSKPLGSAVNTGTLVSGSSALLTEGGKCGGKARVGDQACLHGPKRGRHVQLWGVEKKKLGKMVV